MSIKMTLEQAKGRQSEDLASRSGSNVADVTSGDGPKPRPGGTSRQPAMPVDQTMAALTSYHVGGAVLNSGKHGGNLTARDYTGRLMAPEAATYDGQAANVADGTE
jgi:hypothetical protein